MIFWGHLPWRHLHFKQFSILVWCPQVNLKFEEDKISGCRDILFLIFWGLLQFEVIFIIYYIQYWFCALSSVNFSVSSPQLKYNIWEGSDQWLLRYSILPILRSFSIWGLFISSNFLFLVWSPQLEFQVWGRSILPTPGEVKAKAMPGRLYIHTINNK